MLFSERNCLTYFHHQRNLCWWNVIVQLFYDPFACKPVKWFLNHILWWSAVSVHVQFFSINHCRNCRRRQKKMELILWGVGQNNINAMNFCGGDERDSILIGILFYWSCQQPTLFENFLQLELFQKYLNQLILCFQALQLLFRWNSGLWKYIFKLFGQSNKYKIDFGWMWQHFLRAFLPSKHLIESHVWHCKS